VIHCVVHWYSASDSSLSTTSSPHHHPTETSALLITTDADDVSAESRGHDVDGVSDVRVTSRTNAYDVTGAGSREADDVNLTNVMDDVTLTLFADSDDVIVAGSRGGQHVMPVLLATVLVCIVYFLLNFLSVYAHVNYVDNLFYQMYVWYEAFYRTLMTAVLVVGLVIAARTTPSAGEGLRSRRSGVQYLVLFTSWAPVVQNLLTVIAFSRGSRVWITQSVRTANILGAIVAIFHVAVQTVFVFYAGNLRRGPELRSAHAASDSWSGRRRCVLRLLLVVVALSDVAFWATGSFVAISMAYGYSYRCKFFSHWVPLVSFGVPVEIFYYFNCALLCLDVYLNF